jgi:uncharacterized protein YjiS (DUF1127 family)
MTIASRSAFRPLPLGSGAGSIAAGIASFLARLHALLRRAQATSELRGLSDEQLADVGLDRAAIEPRRPAIEVDAALMRRLMSMS